MIRGICHCESVGGFSKAPTRECKTSRRFLKRDEHRMSEEKSRKLF